MRKMFRGIFLKRFLDRPEEIDIEVTSACDADCIMCPRKAIRRKVGPMELSLFKKIIDEAVKLEVREIHLNGYGEISVLKNYQDYISYIRQKSQRIKIIINTNGMRMNEEMAKFYVKMGVDLVNITIDGATAETYEKIRRNLKFETVEANVDQLMRIRKEAKKNRPLVSVRMIHMPQNEHESEAFLQRWKDRVDLYGVSGLFNRISSVPFAPTGYQEWEKTPCFLLWRQMPVLNDGTVALCCDDWDGKANLGNLNQDSIESIWKNFERQRLRALHLEHRGSEIKLCQGCQQPRQGPWWF